MTMERKNRQQEDKGVIFKEPPCFYKLSAAQLPDELFRKETDASDWIGSESGGSESDNNTSSHRSDMPWMETSANPKGFRAGSLGKVVPLDRMVDFERCVGLPMYMMSNVSPFVVPLATAAWLLLGWSWAGYLAVFVTAYQGLLYFVWRTFLVPVFLKRYKRGPKLADDLDPKDHYHSQYLFTERNVTKYCSMSFVWPKSLQRPALTSTESNNGNANNDRPVIYCLIPHGLAPYGVVGYPYFSKVWNSKLCSWTCAPMLMNIPMVGYYLRAIGYVPAKSKFIMDALTKKDRNVGIVLDGIDGMFQSKQGNKHNEVGAILDRRGICKIALKANVAIVPVYGFGHTDIYDVVVDPFGILRYLSAKLGISLSPFFGRWGWFMGPPKRDVPVTLCLGDPIYPPSPAANPSDNGGGDALTLTSTSASNITQEQIDEHHSKLLDGFTRVFETHKRGYYGEDIGAKKKLVFVK